MCSGSTTTCPPPQVARHEPAPKLDAAGNCIGPCYTTVNPISRSRIAALIALAFRDRASSNSLPFPPADAPSRNLEHKNTAVEICPDVVPVELHQATVSK